jgi:hypothetical protein
MTNRADVIKNLLNRLESFQSAPRGTIGEEDLESWKKDVAEVLSENSAIRFNRLALYDVVSKSTGFDADDIPF